MWRSVAKGPRGEREQLRSFVRPPSITGEINSSRENMQRPKERGVGKALLMSFSTAETICLLMPPSSSPLKTLDFVSWLCVVSSGHYSSKSDFFMFVSIAGFMWDATNLILIFAQLTRHIPRFLLLEMAGDVLWAFLYLIAASVILSKSGGKGHIRVGLYFKHFNVHTILLVHILHVNIEFAI